MLSRSLPSLHDPEEMQQDSCNETSLDRVMGGRDKATLLLENKNSGETFLSVQARKGQYENSLSCNPEYQQTTSADSSILGTETTDLRKMFPDLMPVSERAAMCQTAFFRRSGHKHLEDCTDGQTQLDTNFKPVQHVVSPPDMVIQPEESALEVPVGQDGEPQAELSRIPSLRERVAMYQAAIIESSGEKKLLPGMSSSSTFGSYQQAKPRFGFTKQEGERCKGCGEKVYWADRLAVDNNIYHKSCFRCHHCWSKLSLGNYAAVEGFVYCRPHFKQLFCAKGNYKDGFALGEQALKGRGQGQVYPPPWAHKGNVGGSWTPPNFNTLSKSSERMASSLLTPAAVFPVHKGGKSREIATGDQTEWKGNGEVIATISGKDERQSESFPGIQGTPEHETGNGVPRSGGVDTCPPQPALWCSLRPGSETEALLSSTLGEKPSKSEATKTFEATALKAKQELPGIYRLGREVSAELWQPQKKTGVGRLISVDAPRGWEGQKNVNTTLNNDLGPIRVQVLDEPAGESKPEDNKGDEESNRFFRQASEKNDEKLVPKEDEAKVRKGGNRTSFGYSTLAKLYSRHMSGKTESVDKGMALSPKFRSAISHLEDAMSNNNQEEQGVVKENGLCGRTLRCDNANGEFSHAGEAFEFGEDEFQGYDISMNEYGNEKEKLAIRNLLGESQIPLIRFPITSSTQDVDPEFSDTISDFDPLRCASEASARAESQIIMIDTGYSPSLTLAHSPSSSIDLWVTAPSTPDNEIAEWGTCMAPKTNTLDITGLRDELCSPPEMQEHPNSVGDFPLYDCMADKYGVNSTSVSFSLTNPFLSCTDTMEEENGLVSAAQQTQTDTVDLLS